MRGHRIPITDEKLQALLDGEFSAHESAELLSQVRGDHSLSQEACELRMLKDTVRLAYRDLPEAPQTRRAPVRHRWIALPSIAAGLLILVVGMVLGWSMRPMTDSARFVLLDPNGSGQAPAAADSNEMRIVFHLTDPDSVLAGELLDDVEGLLAEYKRQHLALRVEVVAHGDGLDLLRSRMTQHQERIHRLSEFYPNLTFVACQNSLDRLRVEQGREILLVPEARVTYSGVDYVVRRQKEGWAYIRV